jgi:hypothetical protein
MAVSGKYGKISIPKVGDEEPVFILRAQDKLALGMVQIYKVLVASHGSSMAGALDEEIERFRNWGGRTKMPD